MAYLLFVDESGHDRKHSPYEVLAGVAVRDRDLWSLIQALNDAELRSFGRRYSEGSRELKGLKLLKKKVFQHASLNATIATTEVPQLAKEALDHGSAASIRHWKGLALAKLRYVREVFEICASFKCRIFASVVETDAPNTASAGLRKDYGYLFERFFYFLEEAAPYEQGIIVFDELEKAKSHLLIDQAQRYFRDTQTGRDRSNRIVPEPFFVHSELTTGVQIADLAAYIISWGLRTSGMTKPARTELRPFADQIMNLRYRKTVSRPGASVFEIWSIAHIRDLRTRMEREDDVTS